MITRENVNELLDKGQIEIAMRSGKWWAIRRNGMTKRWKTDEQRIRIPYKFGLYGYGQITETDFCTYEGVSGVLNPQFFRQKAS